MLIRFVVSNFLSFNEETEFNMLAGSFKTHKHHVYNAGKVDVLKAAAIYGANGAGKSNLIKAIDFFQEIVKEGGVTKSIKDKKFRLNEANNEKPSTFEMEFSIEKKIYTYGVSIRHNNIIEEWLYESGVTTEDKMLFERTQTKAGKSTIKMAEKFKKSKKSELLIELMEDNLLKHNEILLGKSDSLKIDEISKIREWLDSNILIIYPKSKFGGLVPILTLSEEFKIFANELLRTFDTGVNELEIETIDFEDYFGKDEEKLKEELIEKLSDNELEYLRINAHEGRLMVGKEGGRYVVKKAVALHKDDKGTNVAFDLNDESDGTQRLLDFIPTFYGILERNVTFIIDEIDQSLHPALLQTLVHKIMTDEDTKGQFIFTTHESNLLDLDIFRQDEIWFVEKDKNKGSTKLYSLSEFKPRYDLDIRKGYLKGRFGAIPFLARLEDLNWHSTHGV